MGYNLSNFIINIGFTFILAIFLLIFYILFCIFIPCRNKSKCSVKIYNYLIKNLFYNTILRFIIEGYLQLDLCAFINLNYLRFDNFSYKTTLIVSIIVLFILFIFTLATFTIPLFYFDCLYDDYFYNKVSSLYFELKQCKRM